MTRRALLWLGLALVAGGLVILVIGAGGGMTGPAVPGVGDPGGPGSPGFIPGTAASPRVVRIVATAQLRFVPDAVSVKQGETVTFEVTSMGPLTHEFMLGPAADVAADKPGTPRSPTSG